MAKASDQETSRELTSDEVLQLANKYLEPHQPADYRLIVLDQGVRQDGDWWYVVVRPDRGEKRAYDYYSRLAEAEIDLRDAENVNVLLVPARAE
jgi:TFIIF-interacting CTD phosphatase-like protein